MPLSPSTLTRLDPDVPLLWRDERTLQFGLDGALRIAADAAWVEILLSRMRTGFRRSAFDVIAHGAGAPWDEARALLQSVGPLLVDDPAPMRPVRVETIGITDTRADHRMREALQDEGLPLTDESVRDAVAVVLVQGAAAAVQFATFLRDDVAHLPVSFLHREVTVGPLVIPGASPCLACRDAHDVDRDPAWPLLHAQLVGGAGRPVAASRIGLAAAAVADLLGAPAGADAAELRISADGSRVSRPVTFHEGCRCRALWSPSRPGNETAPVPLVPRTSPTTATACARRA